MDGRCKDCRHWKRMIAQATGECALAEHDGKRYMHPESLACAVPDYRDGGATLETAPDFGCVQFAAHESKGDGHD